MCEVVSFVTLGCVIRPESLDDTTRGPKWQTRALQTISVLLIEIAEVSLDIRDLVRLEGCASIHSSRRLTASRMAFSHPRCSSSQLRGRTNPPCSIQLATSFLKLPTGSDSRLIYFTVPIRRTKKATNSCWLNSPRHQSKSLIDMCVLTSGK